MSLPDRLRKISTAILVGLWLLGTIQFIRLNGFPRDPLSYFESFFILVMVTSDPVNKNRRAASTTLISRMWRGLVLMSAYALLSFAGFFEIYLAIHGQWAAIVGGCLMLALCREVIFSVQFCADPRKQVSHQSA